MRIAARTVAAPCQASAASDRTSPVSCAVAVGDDWAKAQTQNANPTLDFINVRTSCNPSHLNINWNNNRLFLGRMCIELGRFPVQILTAVFSASLGLFETKAKSLVRFSEHRGRRPAKYKLGSPFKTRQFNRCCSEFRTHACNMRRIGRSQPVRIGARVSTMEFTFLSVF